MPKSKRVTLPASGDGAGLPKPNAITVPDTVTATGNSGGPAEAVGSSPAVITQAIQPANRQGNRTLPPIATRFKKGTSGNLNGRPKGIVSKALTKELKRKIADSGETVLQALIKGYVVKALEEQDPARFNSIRDTVDGKPISQEDGANVGVGLFVQLEVVGR